MRISVDKLTLATLAVAILGGTAAGQGLSPQVKAKVDAKIQQLRSWSSDPTIVAAVKAHNTNPPAVDKAMTNEKWSQLTIIDPCVRSFNKNPLGVYLKGKRDNQIAECFVSGADGTKVAFLSKVSSWSHAGKPKHSLPMSGQTFIGAVEVDGSTGVQVVQVGLPVLEGGRPIGSIVVGLAVAKL